MAHRRVLDYVLGRHYCPACGKAAGFRSDLSYDKRKLPWYRLAPVRLYCNACGTQVRGHLSKGVWVAVAMWIALVFAAGFAFNTLKEQGLIAGNNVEALALTLAVIFSAACLFQVFLSYEVTNDAP